MTPTLVAQEIAEQYSDSGLRDLKAIQGEWIVTKVVRGGQRLKIDVGQQAIHRITADKWIPGRNPEDFTRLKLNGDTTPAQVDLIDLDGLKMLGVYRLNGDDLIFVISRPGRPRPAEVVSENGSPTYSMEFKRRTKD